MKPTVPAVNPAVALTPNGGRLPVLSTGQAMRRRSPLLLWLTAAPRLSTLLLLLGLLAPESGAPGGGAAPPPTPRRPTDYVEPSPAPARMAPEEVGAGLLQACALGRSEIVEAVVKRERANSRFADERGYTCLHIAAQYGHTDVLRLMLGRHGLEEKGLVSAATTAAAGANTPLHLAAGNDQPAAMRVLLLAGADRRALNADGDRPADSAIKSLGTVKAQQVMVTLLHYTAAELEKMDVGAKERWQKANGGDPGPRVEAAVGPGPKRLVHREEPTAGPHKVSGDTVDVRHRGRRGKPPPPAMPPRRPPRNGEL